MLLDITPSHVTPEQWDQIRMMLVWLWGFAGSVIIFAAMLVLGHAVIPSLTSTRDLPAGLMRARPVLLGISAIFFVVAVFCFASFVIDLQNIYAIWDRVWI